MVLVVEQLCLAILQALYQAIGTTRPAPKRDHYTTAACSIHSSYRMPGTAVRRYVPTGNAVFFF